MIATARRHVVSVMETGPVWYVPMGTFRSSSMGELPSSGIANPAYEVDDDAGEESDAGERIAQLEAELAATKREHSKYTSARIAAELEKAQAAHAAELQAERAERERSAAEADALRAELAQLKKDE